MYMVVVLYGLITIVLRVFKI